MGYVTYQEYLDGGYDAVGEAEFDRWVEMAGQYVYLYSFGRIDSGEVTALQKRGFCELVDLLHNDEKQINKSLMSFRNGNYSEVYGLPSKTITVSLQQKIGALLRLYFTQALLYRGVS